MTAQNPGRTGYVLAFLAGAIGGALATKGAPAVLARMEEHCHQMMEAGRCCTSSKEIETEESCCEISSEESRPQSQAA